jgi:transposase
MIIVMDNAAYHKPRDFDWITPHKMNKTACISFLQQYGLKEFTVERDGESIIFKKSTWHLHARNKSAPTVKELQHAVKEYLKQHPDINKTKIDKLLQPHGHFIVWTPPFVSIFQPIELVWAYVKRLVASQYTLNRSILVTRTQTDDAFDTVTPTMVKKRISHCHKCIDEFLSTDDAGSLHQYKTLENLITALPGLRVPADINQITMNEIENDVENEEESQDNEEQ